ncbi:MAG: hypothetical protein ACXAC6_00305 [Candidatus Hodarchaeales archaeon]
MRDSSRRDSEKQFFLADKFSHGNSFLLPFEFHPTKYSHNKLNNSLFFSNELPGALQIQIVNNSPSDRRIGHIY